MIDVACTACFAWAIGRRRSVHLWPTRWQAELPVTMTINSCYCVQRSRPNQRALKHV